MEPEKSSSTEQGLELLKHPVMPLVRILQFLYLTGPFEKISEVLDEFVEPVEMEHGVYQDPAKLLRFYLPTLEKFRFIKNEKPLPWLIFNDQFEPVDRLESVGLFVTQEIMTLELERINSLLCGPCGCRLCCVGPEEQMAQEFFEIPLKEDEVDFFEIPKHDSIATIATSSLREPPLQVEDVPFYLAPTAIYHWKNGWSLILPKNAVCPQLEKGSGRCLIYPDRPNTCRRPQIFCYALEAQPDQDREIDGMTMPAYVQRDKVLAVWDCPYVKEFKQEIGDYAQLSGLEPIFKENKA